MSATLDSALFANYFGGAPVLTAGGRTFPVEHLFLEDVYEATGYHLEADAVNAQRGKNNRAKQRQLQNTASSRHRGVVQVCAQIVMLQGQRLGSFCCFEAV